MLPLFPLRRVACTPGCNLLHSNYWHDIIVASWRRYVAQNEARASEQIYCNSHVTKQMTSSHDATGDVTTQASMLRQNSTRQRHNLCGL